MKVLIAINHPAQYYLFKYFAKILTDKGHHIAYIIKEKDILEQLLINENVDYLKITKRKERKTNLFSIAFNSISELLTQDKNTYKFVKFFKPDIMVGTDIAITHISKLLGIPSLVFNEDDFDINKLFCYSSYPFATKIISPKICNVGKYQYKKISYEGYQKLAYLHPYRFQPEISVLDRFNPNKDPYYLIRLVSFTAGHDIEQSHGGFTNEILSNLIKKLEKIGRVFILSEDELFNEYKNYELQINPIKIHHILYFAEIFIGDSQSMNLEAALLGTPSIRFNSFVGKISVLEELEHKYKLTFGINNKEPKKLLKKIDELLCMPYRKKEFKKRREKMLVDKIDVTAFIVWFVENYPKSAKIMKENPDYQLRFK